MGAIGDLYLVSTVQSLKGQECRNNYFYRKYNILVGGTGGNDANELALDFKARVGNFINAIQIDYVTNVRIEATNLMDLGDVATVSWSGTGAIVHGTSTELVATFAAFAFELLGVGRLIRTGRKFLAGVAESATQQGVVTGASELTAAADIAARMGDDLGAVSGASKCFRPVLVRRVKEVVGDIVKYRLPKTQGEAFWKDVTEVVFDTLLTTMNSRKEGRGV